MLTSPDAACWWSGTVYDHGKRTKMCVANEDMGSTRGRCQEVVCPLDWRSNFISCSPLFKPIKSISNTFLFLTLEDCLWLDYKAFHPDQCKREDIPKRNLNSSQSNLRAVKQMPTFCQGGFLCEPCGRKSRADQYPSTLSTLLGRYVAWNRRCLFYSELTCPCLFGDKWTTGSCRMSLPLGLSRKAGSTFDTAGRWHVGSAIQHRKLWCGH